MLELMLLSNLKKLKFDPGVFQKLLASDGAASDQFGVSVAISNTSVVVGAYSHLGKGAAYVY